MTKIKLFNNIANSENLFRRIKSDKVYYYDRTGKLRLTSEAFSDPKKEPSVDISSLCSNNPAHTQKNPSDGVVYLLTGEFEKQKFVAIIIVTN